MAEEKKKPQLKATRYGYGEGLVELGKKNPKVIVLGLDLTTSTCANMFKEKFPDRFFSLGIQEANAAGVAAGLSLVGFVPFICTYGVFSTGRCWDQVRTTVCYTNCNVKIGGGHGGISVGPDGATHQALEDITLMRVLPNMKVIVPCDYVETKKATIAIANMEGPVFIRFGREPVPMVTKENTPFRFGKAEIFREGKDVTVFACGALVFDALKSADKLEKEGISVKVINIHTIKPIDEEAIIKAAEETKAVVTAEEHQLAGGFGSAVLEVLAQGCAVPIEMVGIKDRFGESGDPRELMHEFGVTHEQVTKAIKRVLKRKK